MRRGSADGWARCERGHSHWGQAGAAGLLVRHIESGRTTWLLQHRAPFTHHGDTWGIPGGALAWDETPVEGAWREAVEELGGVPADLRVVGTYVDDHGGWSYSTIVAETDTAFVPTRMQWETGDQGVRWVGADELDALTLHPGLAESLPRLLADYGEGEVSDA